MEEKNENVEKPKKEKNSKKKRIIIIIILLLVLLAAGVVAIIIKNRKEEQKKIEYAYKTAYESAITTYGDAVSDEIHDYMENNGGKVPEWDDIKESIKVLNEKVKCNATINYDGSLYLEKCKVKGIDYTSNYTYGEKLVEPEVSDDKIYIYVAKSGEDDYYLITSTLYENEEYYKLIDTYNCIEDSCQGYNISKYSKQAVIYDEKNYYIYDYKTKNKTKLNLGNEVYSDVRFLSSEKADYGLTVMKAVDGYGALYNLKNNEYISDFIYSFGY